MAENTMVKEQLTDGMIEAGARLTAKLDEAGVPIVAALWLFMPEVNEWRLLFASPEVSTQGPRAVYAKVRRVVEEAGDLRLPLSIIGVMETEADLVQFLKGAIQTGPGIARLRFSKNVINGHFIDDALIYRAA